MRYLDPRADMVEFVPFDASKVLDVGCAAGRFGASLRERGFDGELWGIDPELSAYEPHSVYEKQIAGCYPDDVPQGETFDCIMFNDILEHLVDPWSTLRQTHDLLGPGSSVVASIPNIRNWRVLHPLVLHGRWDYAEAGILDRTHLRFFTGATARELFESSGFVVDRLEPHNLDWNRRLRQLNRLLAGSLDDFLCLQHVVVAHSRSTNHNLS